MWFQKKIRINKLNRVPLDPIHPNNGEDYAINAKARGGVNNY